MPTTVLAHPLFSHLSCRGNQCPEVGVTYFTVLTPSQNKHQFLFSSLQICTKLKSHIWYYFGYLKHDTNNILLYSLYVLHYFCVS